MSALYFEPSLRRECVEASGQVKEVFMSGMHIKFKISPEELVAQLTNAAYETVLKYGFKEPFIEVELDLLASMRNVVERDIIISDFCGSAQCLSLRQENADHLLQAACEGKSQQRQMALM